MHVHAQCSVSILFEKDGTFETLDFKDVRSHEIYKNSPDSLSIMKLKYHGSKEWEEISIESSWGFIINEDSQKAKTYQFINNKSYKLIEGSIEGNALYNKHFQMYLILVFIWKDTYYLSYDDQMIELKSKKHLTQTFEGTCIGDKIAPNQNRWISWWVTKTKKLDGKSRLMSMIEKCDEMSSQEK